MDSQVSPEEIDNCLANGVEWCVQPSDVLQRAVTMDEIPDEKSMDAAIFQLCDGMTSFAEIVRLLSNRRQDSPLSIEEIQRAATRLVLSQRVTLVGPNSAQAILIRGMDDLQEALFERGWAGYDFRFVARGQVRRLPQSLWQGESLAGKSILVHREQGIGDEILYASCFPDLLRDCGHGYISCDTRLAPLFERSFAGATIITAEDEAAERQRWRAIPADYQIPVASIPRYLRRNMGMFPQETAYLVADPQRAEQWRDRFAQLAGIKVGIVWHGGRSETGIRDLPWPILAGLLKLQPVQFVNLQYGDCSKVLKRAHKELGVHIHDWEDSDRWSDIDGLAAQISELDIVLAIPGSTAHLAGALGVPVWFLFTPSWGRFYITTDFEIPWHSSAQVFPTQDGRWTPVISAVRRELERFINEPAARNDSSRTAHADGADERPEQSTPSSPDDHRE